jgi:hypothetical protein
VQVRASSRYEQARRISESRGNTRFLSVEKGAAGSWAAIIFRLLIARVLSQTAIRPGGTGHEIRTLGL